LSRDIGCFLPFSLLALAVTISATASVKTGLQSLYLFHGQSYRFWWSAGFRHAPDKGGEAHPRTAWNAP
jgi:hypothetical protein